MHSDFSLNSHNSKSLILTPSRRGVLYSVVFVPAIPNDGCLPKPSVLYFLLQTSTIPSGACHAQYSAVFVSAAPDEGLFLQPSVLHILLQTSTIPLGACCAQYSTVFVPATPTDAHLPQLSFLHFMLKMLTIPYGACCTVLRNSCAGHSNVRSRAAALGCALSALGVDHPVWSVLCAAVRGFPVLVPNIGISLNTLARYFELLEKLIVPSLTCYLQHYRVG